MQTLIIPFIIIFIPTIMLLSLLQYLRMTNQISTSLKVFLGFAFVIVGMLASFYAMTVSMDGMSQKGIRCATGAIAFIPLGFIVNIIGVPILLVSFKNANRKSLEV